MRRTIYYIYSVLYIIIGAHKNDDFRRIKRYYLCAATVLYIILYNKCVRRRRRGCRGHVSDE